CCPASYSDPRALHSLPTRRSSDLSRASSGLLPVSQLVKDLDLKAFHNSSVFTECQDAVSQLVKDLDLKAFHNRHPLFPAVVAVRSEEHTSELQSRENLVCRLPLEK